MPSLVADLMKRFFSVSGPIFSGLKGDGEAGRILLLFMLNPSESTAGGKPGEARRRAVALPLLSVTGPHGSR
ncbi:hypothetical protein D3C85_1714030 [compost metagenome]